MLLLVVLKHRNVRHLEVLQQIRRLAHNRLVGSRLANREQGVIREARLVHEHLVGERGTFSDQLFSQAVNRLPNNIGVAFHNVRMMSGPSENAVDAQPLADGLPVIEGETALLIYDERVRRSPCLDPDLMELSAQLLLSPVS